MKLKQLFQALEKNQTFYYVIVQGINQRILNSISIDALLTQPCKIKILLVLTQSHFEVDRGKSALEIMDEAVRFLTDYKQLKSCVGLVVTKVMPGTSIERCLK